eukprot:1361242-Amorphochlora_amoeboformis.AAC.1
MQNSYPNEYSQYITCTCEAKTRTTNKNKSVPGRPTLRRLSLAGQNPRRQRQGCQTQESRSDSRERITESGHRGNRRDADTRLAEVREAESREVDKRESETREADTREGGTRE